jgi:hypothetical protein
MIRGKEGELILAHGHVNLAHVKLTLSSKKQLTG